MQWDRNTAGRLERFGDLVEQGCEVSVHSNQMEPPPEEQHSQHSQHSQGLAVEGDAIYNCSTSAGAAGRATLGPFGILVLANDELSELTPIYFYIAKDTDGSYKTFFCSDLSRFIPLLIN